VNLSLYGSKSHGAFSIDLHGLTLDEAKSVAKDRTQAWHASQNFGTALRYFMRLIPLRKNAADLTFLYETFRSSRSVQAVPNRHGSGEAFRQPCRDPGTWRGQRIGAGRLARRPWI